MAEVTKKIKPLSSAFEGMGTAVSKINLSDFRLSYNASSSLKNSNLSHHFLSDEKNMNAVDLFAYSLGFKGRTAWDIVTGNYDDENFGGMQSRIKSSELLSLARNDNRTASQDWSISTSLRLPSPLDLNLNTIRLGWDRSYTVKPPKLVDTPPEDYYQDTSLTWPSFQVGASTTLLEKFPFVAASMKSLSLNSDYQFDRTIRKTNTDSSVEMSHGFNPLVGLNGRIKKWPITVTYSHDMSFGSTVNHNLDQPEDTAATTESKSHSDRLEVKHTIRAGNLKEIKIFRWTIPIKGELAWGIKGDHSYELQEDRGTAQVDYQKWSIAPYVYYDFTDNVRGTFEYTGSWEDREAPSQETYNTHALWLKVRISF
jgi:hypothetical protein